jgi:hypothetical protein
MSSGRKPSPPRSRAPKYPKRTRSTIDSGIGVPFCPCMLLGFMVAWPMRLTREIGYLFRLR